MRIQLALSFLGLMLLGTIGARADVTFEVLPGGTLTADVANVISPPSFLALDLQGASSVAVFNGTPLTLIGAASVSNLFDLPFPNTTLLAENFSATQFIAFVLGTYTVSGTQLLVNETGVPFGGPVTDPGLVAFEGPLVFDFTYQTTIDADDVSASYFTLSGVTVPEPSSLATVLVLSMGLLATRRFVRSR